MYEGGDLIPTSVQVCGDYSIVPGEPVEQISVDSVVRTPSDHLCVVADFDFFI
jgi:hypothetical protein